MLKQGWSRQKKNSNATLEIVMRRKVSLCGHICRMDADCQKNGKDWRFLEDQTENGWTISKNGAGWIASKILTREWVMEGIHKQYSVNRLQRRSEDLNSVRYTVRKNTPGAWRCCGLLMPSFWSNDSLRLWARVRWPTSSSRASARLGDVNDDVIVGSPVALWSTI